MILKEKNDMLVSLRKHSRILTAKDELRARPQICFYPNLQRLQLF